MRHRKTASYLNSLRRDVQVVLDEMNETGIDLSTAAGDLSVMPVHDIATNPEKVTYFTKTLAQEYRKLGKLLKQFKIVSVKYSEFF
jgi:hypothetical protein